MTTRRGTSGDITIAPMIPDDCKSFRRIYADGITTGNVTFETELPRWEAWNRSHHSQRRLVARIGDAIVAWAALSPISARACYAGVAENSIYVDEAYKGRSIGNTLMAEFVRQSEAVDFWTLQNGIFPENHASIAIHLAAGFRTMGRRKPAAMLIGV